MFEVVEFRVCDCNEAGCPGEKEFIHFVHKDRPMCKDFILRYSLEFDEIKEYKANGDRFDIIGYLLNGRKFVKKLRIQESGSQSHGKVTR